MCRGTKLPCPCYLPPPAKIKHPKRLIRSPGSTFSSIGVKHSYYHGACIQQLKILKSVRFFWVLFQGESVVRTILSLSRKELSPEICLPDVQPDSLGTKFDMQPTSLEEENR